MGGVVDIARIATRRSADWRVVRVVVAEARDDRRRGAVVVVAQWATTFTNG